MPKWTSTNLPIKFNIGGWTPSPRRYLWNVGHLPDGVRSDRKPTKEKSTEQKRTTSAVGKSVNMDFFR